MKGTQSLAVTAAQSSSQPFIHCYTVLSATRDISFHCIHFEDSYVALKSRLKGPASIFLFQFLTAQGCDVNTNYFLGKVEKVLIISHEKCESVLGLVSPVQRERGLFLLAEGRWDCRLFAPSLSAAVLYKHTHVCLFRRGRTTHRIN